jgi:serine/threonine protein kinase
MTERNIGAYRVLREIGQGGMSTVYEASHITQRYRVALKVLAPSLSRDPSFVKRFREEYQTVHSLYHRHIVQVYEFGEDKGRYFIAAEYIDGQSLAQRLSQVGVLGLRETVSIVQQIASALDAAHQREIVHRDLKPSNILIESSGRVVLTDFGIAYIIRGQSRTPSDKIVLGTPDYMSPEQAQGDANITPRADIYALGVMTYQMLTGRTPFQRDVPLAVLHAHLHETPPPMPIKSANKSITENVERLVLQTLDKDPKQRPARAGDFAHQLARAAGVRSSAPPQRSQRVPVIPLLSVFGVVMVVLMLISRPSPPPPSPTVTPPGPEESLAYACQAGSGNLALCFEEYVMGRRRLSGDAPRWAPMWSPDGQRLAFVVGVADEADIWVLDLERGSAEAVRATEGIAESSPAWSPDGKSLVFDMNVDGNYDIYTAPVDGGEALIQLTSHPGQDSDAAWSPDGQHIVFVSDRDGDLDLYMMGTEGQNVTRLTHHSGWDFAPVWSPDGRWIAYECMEGAAGSKEICVIDSQGGQRSVLTHNTVDDRHPAWSPDGHHIAFCRERGTGGIWDIWIMERDGKNPRVRIRDGNSNTHPTWMLAQR